MPRATCRIQQPVAAEERESAALNLGDIVRVKNKKKKGKNSEEAPEQHAEVVAVLPGDGVKLLFTPAEGEGESSKRPQAAHDEAWSSDELELIKRAVPGRLVLTADHLFFCG